MSDMKLGTKQSKLIGTLLVQLKYKQRPLTDILGDIQAAIDDACLESLKEGYVRASKIVDTVDDNALSLAIKHQAEKLTEKDL